MDRRGSYTPYTGFEIPMPSISLSILSTERAIASIAVEETYDDGGVFGENA